MTFHRLAAAFILSAIAFCFACSAAKVTRAQLEALKPGDIVVFRYDKDGKTMKYSEKIARIEGDTIYYFPSKYETPGGGKDDYKIRTDFVETSERSRTKEEFYKYETEQGPEKRTAMWIE